MSSIGSIGGISSGGNWASALQRPQRPSKEELLQRADSDGSGGVDASELQQMLAQRPGATSSTSASGSSTDATSSVDFSSLDGDGSGSLDATELDAAMKALMPKPSSTMEFAQQRGGLGNAGGEGGSDDLFSKVDSNGDGSLDSDELTALQEKMGIQDDEAFSRLDSDGSGSLSADEFAAGRPQGGQGAQGTLNVQGSAQGPQGAQGGRGPGGPGGAGGPPPAGGGQGGDSASSTDSTSSTTYDPLDTNEDGVVSAQERAAGELKELMQQALQVADSDGDQSLSASELSSFKDAVTQALGAATSGSGSSSSSSSGSGQDGSANGKLQEQAAKLVDWMLKQYAGAGAQGGNAFAATGTQVNVSA